MHNLQVEMLFKAYIIAVVKQPMVTQDSKAAGQQFGSALHLPPPSALLFLTTAVLSCGLVACKEV